MGIINWIILQSLGDFDSENESSSSNPQDCKLKLKLASKNWYKCAEFMLENFYKYLSGNNSIKMFKYLSLILTLKYTLTVTKNMRIILNDPDILDLVNKKVNNGSLMVELNDSLECYNKLVKSFLDRRNPNNENRFLQKEITRNYYTKSNRL